MKTARSGNPLARVVVGLVLLVPSSYFAFSLTLQIIFSYTRLYYNIAPAFLESDPAIFSFNTSAWILYGPAGCVLLNLPAAGKQGIFILLFAVFTARHWFNTATFLQAIILFILSSAGTLLSITGINKRKIKCMECREN